MEHNLSNNVLNLINDIAHENGFKKFNIKNKSDWQKCEGFASDIVAVDLISDDRNLELILKLGPKNVNLRKTIPFEKVFQRESYVYTSILHEYENLQRRYNILNCNLFDKYPICFKTSLEYLDEVLIIENLSVARNYSLWNKHKVMTNNHIELVFKEYAKLHALSFALRKLDSKKFKEFSENTQDVYMGIIKACGTADIIKNMCKRVQKYLESAKNLKVVENLSKQQNDIITIMDTLVDVKAPGDYGVFCHGDNWTNNILFKYKDENNPDLPTDVKFIDWQLARYGSPVLDLSYFLYTCAGKDTFNNLNNLLDVYYNSFSTFLTCFNLDANEVFPFEVLKSHWRKYAKFGLGMAYLVVHVMVKSEEETPKMENDQSSEDFLKTFETSSVNDQEYFRRISDILNHFVDYNLL